MDKSSANHFLVLFRDEDGSKFRSVYEYFPESETVSSDHSALIKDSTKILKVSSDPRNISTEFFMRL